MAAIETVDLTKEFDGIVAVDRVSLKIEEGELFGLLGPNGAGKTTLVHMLSTILTSTDGEAKVWGNCIRKDSSKVRSLIGIVFQDPSSDEQLTGMENLDFHGRMYGIPEKERKERAKKFLKMVDLEDRANDLVKEYSGGMRRRLELARGFLHEPKVLFLDEPTLGLDPQTRRKIWDYIQKLNDEEGVTMVLTTHYMEEADYLCDRVGIIDEGKIIALDKPDRLKNELKGDIVTLKLDNGKDFARILRNEEIVREVKFVDETLQLRVDDGESSIPKLLSIVQDNGGQVKSVGLRRPTLEDVFIRKTGRRIREEKTGAKERSRMMRRARG
ncbi:ABC transporter ATP-binding protein [candidate division MSBL1 archaeon SCGC-AAA259D14]|uniref:ABC transporter ATP-binding protein n=2 Tax=candidate division MSBL1 TaxID=215777 RepID=A0A133U944_9EURY|nr:ABC transporter ATP-binding protein [candidate division MSBL1 archaeon SCGC-AAA259D14]KXA98533.1 ABC transporter ATP-binding protein [candidate division MSBL1 archaeon SCGC-AAA259J03]